MKLIKCAQFAKLFFIFIDLFPVCLHCEISNTLYCTTNVPQLQQQQQKQQQWYQQ